MSTIVPPGQGFLSITARSPAGSNDSYRLDAAINDPGLGLGTFTFADLPVHYGSAIFAFVPFNIYDLQRDRDPSGDLTLVLTSFVSERTYTSTPRSHGTLDAVLPFDKGLADMGVPRSNCTLHVAF